MQSLSNKEYFFETTASIEESKRKAAKAKNNNGNPIRLKSKILAIAADPCGQDAVYVAESAGTVRKVVLETGESAAVFRGPTAPVTSVAFSPDGKIVFAGCWDKTVWSWDVQSKRPLRRYEGHTDFVKSVITARVAGQDILVSGSADATIAVYSIATGERLHVFKEEMRGIQDLCIDPWSLENPSRMVLFSSGSDREIRQFPYPATDAFETAQPILAHETSVFKIYFDNDGDLWTASADKTAKCLVRENGWKANLTLEHPDFVRDVVVHDQGGWVVTACRDEEVRVWNKATGELYHVFSGHVEEVTGLLLIGHLLVSVSIDATIRKWSLRPADLQRAREEAQNKGAEDEEQKQAPMLTEEEERELAELLEEDD